MRKLIRYIRFIKAILLCRKGNKPILTTLCVTNKCNLNCTYCYRDKSSSREFTTDELLKLIDDLYIRGMRYISLNGGEPLLRNDLSVIIDRIQKKNILFHISTNGLLVPQNIDILKRVDSIALSLDGISESNDINRGDKSYSKVIAAIECLNKNNIKFYINTVLTKNNINAIEEVMALSKKYNFKVQISFLRETKFIGEYLALNIDEMKQAIEKIISYKEQGYKVFFSKQTYKYISRNINNEKQLLKCRLKNIACHIESNGDVYPCVVLVDKFKALNIFEVGLDNALNNLRNNTCSCCNNACCTDLNYLFSFNPKVVLNTIKNAL